MYHSEHVGGILSSMRTRIEIDTQTFVRFWLVVFGFALAALLIYGARNALLLIGIAFFLALAFSRPVSWLAKKLPGNNRVGASAIAFLALVAVVSSIVFLVVPPIIEQSARLADNFPVLIENAQRQWTGLNDIIQKHNLQPQIDQAINNIRDSIGSWAGTLGQGVVSGLGSVITFISTSLIVLFMTFFMLVEGPVWSKRIWLLYEDTAKMKRHEHLLERMYNVVTGYVTGQVVVSAIDGLFAGLAVFVLSFFFQEVPASLALPVAALSFVLSMIPMFGATIAGALAAILIALNNIPAAVIYVVYFFIYQQVENNVVVPTVQSKSLNLSALVIIVAVTIGIFMFGIVGGIIAIPIAGCIKILIEEYVAKVQQERLSDIQQQKNRKKRAVKA